MFMSSASPLLRGNWERGRSASLRDEAGSVDARGVGLSGLDAASLPASVQYTRAYVA